MASDFLSPSETSQITCAMFFSCCRLPSAPTRPRSVGPSPRMSTRMLLNFLDQLLFALVVDQLTQHQKPEPVPNVRNVGEVVDLDVILVVAEEHPHFGGIDIIEQQRG